MLYEMKTAQKSDFIQLSFVIKDDGASRFEKAFYQFESL